MSGLCPRIAIVVGLALLPVAIAAVGWPGAPWALAGGLALGLVAAWASAHWLILRHAAALARLAEGNGAAPDAVARGLSQSPAGLTAVERTLTRLADDTERSARATTALRSVRERLTLELHHRVRNNLQTISSMINLQRRRLDEVGRAEALQRVQSRIHALALVHQNVLAGDDGKSADLGVLLREIVDDMAGSHVLVPESVRAVVPRGQPITAEVEVASPIALFVTEALAELLAASETPRLTVTLAHEASGFSLRVTGPGQGSALDPEVAGSSLGQLLLDGFARQLGATMTIARAGADDLEIRLALAAPRRRVVDDFRLCRQRAANVETEPERRDRMGRYPG